MSGQAAKHAWTKDFKFALHFNKIICWPLGVWPEDYDSMFSKFRLIFSLMSQLWLMYVELVAVYSHCGNASDSIDYVMASTCAFMAISKIITFRVHMKDIHRVFISAMNHWLSVEDDNDRAIMISFAKTGRLVFQLQLGFSYACIFIPIIGNLSFVTPQIFKDGALANGSVIEEMPIVRQLPSKSGCLFDHYVDDIYGLLYVYDSITFIILVHGCVGCDVVLFSVLTHLCGQIELIKKYLRDAVVTSEGSAVKMQGKFVKFIEKHSEMLDMAESIKITISELLVMQLFCNVGIYLMIGLSIIMVSKDDSIFNTVKIIIGFFVLIQQLYLISCASDRLSRQSESIVEAVYESQWHELPPKLREKLCFVAMRANRPIKLVAGQFYALNLENFKNILMACFSYFSVLRVMLCKS